jgi:hypothetical protein
MVAKAFLLKTAQTSAIFTKIEKNHQNLKKLIYICHTSGSGLKSIKAV